MKVFITGGTGNIGQYVTLAAIDAGHETVVLSRNPEKYPSLEKKAKLVKGTITDYAILKDCIKDCKAVIHIALGWGNDPVSMLANDTTATVNLLEISEKAGVEKFIYTSSTAAMGVMRNGMDETVVNLPVDLYGSTKAASEGYVLGFTKYFLTEVGMAELFGRSEKVTMKRNIIRPGYTYSTPPYPDGSTEPDARFRKIAEAVVSNKPVELTKYDGTQFISAQEIAQLYMKLLESDKDGEIYLALGNTWVSWEKIAKIALELCPESKSQIVLNDLGWGADPYIYNVTKMERDFGLSFDSQQDLREHVRWCVEEAKKR
ncbi:MAG: NAD(P)-dependent oxidoreductase [Treponema sp.]|nr:NAD(P)-dependent oxidoreductase [Treponema sp.]MCL2238225.1 NAD(P)-dependent oxidoreductase [Treponema sp.]